MQRFEQHPMQRSLQRFWQALALTALIGLAPLALAQEMAPINVNTADAEMLTELPGIGDTRATAIVENREANGDFESADDLTRVSGIGDATVEALREQVAF